MYVCVFSSGLFWAALKSKYTFRCEVGVPSGVTPQKEEGHTRARRFLPGCLLGEDGELHTVFIRSWCEFIAHGVRGGRGGQGRARGEGHGGLSSIIAPPPARYCH